MTRRRSGKLEGKDIEHLETVEKKGRLFYMAQMLGSIRIRSSIIQNRLAEIGKIEPTCHKGDYSNADRKRFCLGRAMIYRSANLQ
jgi:hypothetical protein